MQINNPIPREWTKYVTQTGLGLEEIPDQLYDAETYVDNTTTDLVFFNDVEANQSLSNMTQPGMLPNPQSFLVQTVQLYFRTTVETADQGAAGALASLMNDIVLLVNTGRFTLTFGNKSYGPWRPWTMPAGSYLQGMMAAGGGEAANLVSGYAQLGGPLWVLDPYLMISPLQNFEARMQWPAVVDTSGDVVIEVLMAGKRARAIQ